MNPTWITVVSGLPRSGTSMMMQMLHAGGLPILTDGIRQPDSDNPRGYWEYEPVKALARFAEWLPLAQGKAVKIVHALLPFLPAQYNYRVILMQRDLREVIASQTVMLQRLGRPGANLSSERLAEIFAAQLETTTAWLAAQTNCLTLPMEHRQCHQAPSTAAARINDFLGGHLDEAKMAAAVGPDLYRQKR